MAGAMKPGQSMAAPVAVEELGPTGLDAHVGFMLRVAVAAVIRDLARELEAFELRPRHYACLVVLHAEPGLQQQRLGEILSVKHSNLVATIDELENRGVLMRTRLAQDRRANVLNLTKTGEALLKRLRAAERAHRARLVRALGNRELTRLLNSLNRLARLS